MKAIFDYVKEYLKVNSLDEFTQTINEIDEEGLITELSYESAKLAYVTSEKQFHLTKATKHFKLAIFLWAILLILSGTIEIWLA